MKISILLPYKENFSPNYPGAVSLFVNDTLKISKFKKQVKVYGNTYFKKKFSKRALVLGKIVPLLSFMKVPPLLMVHREFIM